MKHVELIIDYLIDGEDFQYFDNTGKIVRCKDCKHVEYTPASSWKRPYACRITSKGLGYCPDDGNGFCPYGERKENE